MALFQSSPDLPPIGANTRASRTVVEVYNEAGQRVFSRASIKSADQLNSIRFTHLPAMPSVNKMHLELDDRKQGTKARSNTISLQ